MHLQKRPFLTGDYVSTQQIQVRPSTLKSRWSDNKAQICWHAATVVDILHWVVIGLLLFGPLIYGMFWSVLLSAVTITLQLCFLHCPMVVLANWLRGFKAPHYWQKSGMSRGLVYVLYRRWGIAAVIPIALGLSFPIWYIPMVLS